MKIFKAPESFEYHIAYDSVFLAGSIEMGTVEDWQTRVENELGDYADDLLTVLNPRRADFQTNQEQSINNPYFNEQVSWEMAGLKEATYIFMYFHPNTKAPITLLELGMYANSDKIIIVCPEGFWRKGNVEMIADAYNIPLCLSLEEGIDKLRGYIDTDRDTPLYL